MRRRFNTDEMARRRSAKAAWVRQHVDLFIQADVYAEQVNIRPGYWWQGHLKYCPAAITILTEVRSAIFYMALPYHKGGPELRLDIWHSLYDVTWKKRIRPTVENYDYLVQREKQKKISAASDPIGMIYP